MELQFTSPKNHPAETVLYLLKQAWDPLWNPILEKKIQQFDQEVTEQPCTVGACVFITCLESEPIGMASYDPRQSPAKGIIGWNCVIPEYQRKGFGRRQIQEVLRLFRNKGIRKACVTTTDEDFFVPAQRMYEACDFIKVRKTKDNNIEYELEL